MAWRPNENLIDGELSNRIPGKVTGWMRFFRRQMQSLRVAFDLEGAFHEDIRGSDILLMNGKPTDKNISLERDGTYMEGFDPQQRGSVGDMTAGFPLAGELYYPYVDYPYLEWYSENGRVVLEL